MCEMNQLGASSVKRNFINAVKRQPWCVNLEMENQLD